MKDLWGSRSVDSWREALEAYGEVVQQQGVTRLAELDRWFREEFPGLVAARRPPHVTSEELAKATEWKMARGVWRARNLALVRGNDPDEVVRRSTEALAAIPDAMRPIRLLAELAGVGPATASAIASATSPERYPFFDELVAAQVPGLGPVAFTLTYYARYAEKLRERASQLGEGWTPTDVERALWANSGGKAGIKSAR